MSRNAGNAAYPASSTLNLPFVPEKLRQWARDNGPSALITGDEINFILEIHRAAAFHVGYGWMQAIIEWIWQESSGEAWGPEYFQNRINELEEEIKQLKLKSKRTTNAGTTQPGKITRKTPERDAGPERQADHAPE